MEYLASPYSHSLPIIMERRYAAAMAVTAKLLGEGRIIYSPIVSFHEVAIAHNLPTNFAFWERINLGVLAHCSNLIVLKLDGWKDSVGVAGEVEYAMRMGIPVEYFTWQT